MRKILFIFIMCASVSMVSCGKRLANNPLVGEFDTPLETPPFGSIKLKHFKPALEEAMRLHDLEIEKIITNAEEPSFENVIAPLDASGKLLARTNSIFSTLHSNVSDDRLMALSKDIAPRLTAHYDGISLNPDLFWRVKYVYDNRDRIGDSLARRTVEKYYDNYIREGAMLDEAQRAEMKEINSALASASIVFGDNLLKETKRYKLIIENTDDLAGLPENVISAAASDAQAAGLAGKWLFTVDKSSMLPFLTYSDKRDLREKIYNAYYNRGALGNGTDNSKVAVEILSLSTRKAQLLGYKSYADYVIAENMARTPENVYGLMLQLWDPALAKAKEELAELQAIADEEGKGVKVEAWDWWYYTEKLRRSKLNFDEEMLRPYFSVDHVRDGMFYVANRLYGIKMTRLDTLQVYHPDVEVFEVKDKDNKHLALLYLDYYPREGKEGGAWCSSLRDYDYNGGNEVFPLVTITCNLTKPVDGRPALLSWDDTETMFHEFGHALHSVFSRGPYGYVTGNVPKDMVELPSQIMENWAAEPEVLRVYARHYLTGEVLPEDLIKHVAASSRFNQGWATTEHVAAALLDLDLYTRTEVEDFDVLLFEKAAMDKYGLIPQIAPRYRTTFYQHIFQSGYSAQYYVYTWASVLDSDAFAAFKETGNIFDTEKADSFRKNILAEGGYADGMVQYGKFRGSEPSVTPLMNKKGF